jgi:hypothetical protein
VSSVYDSARRRRSERKQRERGCRIYVPQEELRKAGWPDDAPPPFYRVWGTPGGQIIVRLYTEE